MSSEPNCGVGHGCFGAGARRSSEERQCQLCWVSVILSLTGGGGGQQGTGCGGLLGIWEGVWGSTQDFKHHCNMLLVPTEEMRRANSHALLPHPQGVFLGLLNRKLIHRSAVQHPIYEILNPNPVILPDELHCFGIVGSVNTTFGGGGGVLGYVLVGGMAVALQCTSGPPPRLPWGTWYGVEGTWGVRRGLTGVEEVVGVRLDEGGEGGGVSNGGWGEASSLRHFSA